MAEEGSGGGGGGSDVLFIVLILAGIGLAWVASGGPERTDVRSLFIQAPFEAGDIGGIVQADDASLRSEVGAITGETAKVEGAITLLGSAASSPHRGTVRIYSTDGAQREDPQSEQIVLEADPGNAARVAISGWTLESALTGRSARIGPAADPLVLGRASEGALYLEPGDRVVVGTGRSPVGSSFRLNSCSGYLNQFQTFEPQLTERCPLPLTETKYSSSRNLGDACYEFLESFPSCRLELSLPETLSESCRSFILENLTYNGCVANHRNDPAFSRNEWRAYLNQPAELWKDRFEVIKLLDGEGGLVDSATY